jgi:HK97 family phage prohead protease
MAKLLKKTTLGAGFKLLADEDGPGGFEGYASTFGNKDRAGEIVVKGAFQKSLDRFKSDGFIAIGHDWGGLPVATVTEAYEDEKGLFIKGEFHSTKEAQDARTVMQERLARGKSVGLSIGYEVKDAEQTAKGRLLKEIELYETSIVTVPCNPEANATEAKGAEFKAEYLSDYVEADMTLAALRALQDSLYYDVIWECLFYGEMDGADRLERLQGAFQEYAAIASQVCERLLSLEGGEKAAAEAEFKRLWPKPEETKISEGVAPAPAVSRMEAAAAALRAGIEEAETHKAARRTEGRELSQADQDRVKTLRGLLKDGDAALGDLLPEPAFSLEYYDRKARMRGLALGLGT